MKRYELLILGIVAALFVFPRPAAAYLDPVTGSIIWQAVVGGFLAASLAIRLYWRKIRSLFSKKDAKSDPNEP